MSSRLSHLPRILRVPRSDDPAAYVLVHVLPTGSAALDLKLIATEGESPYVGSGAPLSVSVLYYLIGQLR